MKAKDKKNEVMIAPDSCSVLWFLVAHVSLVIFIMSLTHIPLYSNQLALFFSAIACLLSLPLLFTRGTTVQLSSTL